MTDYSRSNILLPHEKHLKPQAATATVATLATLATVTPSKHFHIKISTTVLLVSLLASCQPSYAIAPHYQPLNNHSVNVDAVSKEANHV